MGREHRTEDTSGDTETGTTSTGRDFVIVGAPGVGKGDLDLAVRTTLTELSHRPQPWLWVAPMGFQADYRSELLVASNRACTVMSTSELDYLHTTTLIDSLAYAITNTRRLAENEGVNEEMVNSYAWAAGCIMWMFRHSLRYDHIFHIQSEDIEDDEVYDFQTLLTQLLDDNSFPYTVLNGDSSLWPEQVIEVIRDYGSS